MVNHQQRT